MGDSPGDQGQFERLLQLIAAASDHDLRGHKPESIELHVRRRMQAHRISSLSEYLRLLDQSTDELLRLHREILNGVTRFFRDDSPFEALKASVFPGMIAAERARPVRMWVPACASGEEAYSLAICWLECTAALGRPVAAEIIGTDINGAAVHVARRGSYPSRAGLAISKERLARYFISEASGYRVAPTVRELVDFRTHDITLGFEPRAFDLVSCRNLLIYLRAEAQRQVLCNVYSSLREGGWLLLGNSETVGDSPDLFSLIDGRHRIYQAKPNREERYA
jgi:two-component system, chemotaxis family, CheB/CheR fusion protein